MLTLTPNTNLTGKILTGLGALLALGWLVFGLKDGFRLFEGDFLTSAIVAACLIVGGLYLRSLGLALMWAGGTAALLAILHAGLVELLGIRALAVNFNSDTSSGQVDFLVFLLGVLAVGVGFFFSRDEREEAVIYRNFWGVVSATARFVDRRMTEAATASAERERRQRAHERRRAIKNSERPARVEPTPSGPHCPNCRAEATGNPLFGNRIIDCLRCGGAFCGSCASGWISSNCPHCGNDSQDEIKFRDTGVGWF